MLNNSIETNSRKKGGYGVFLLEANINNEIKKGGI